MDNSKKAALAKPSPTLYLGPGGKVKFKQLSDSENANIHSFVFFCIFQPILSDSQRQMVRDDH